MSILNSVPGHSCGPLGEAQLIDPPQPTNKPIIIQMIPYTQAQPTNQPISLNQLPPNQPINKYPNP